MEKKDWNELALIREFDEKNTALRFLANLDQLQSGAMLRLQWCIAPQVVEYLRKEQIKGAQLFITITDPRGREKRLVRPLTSPQELIEFHCPGAHKISGTVVWGPQVQKSTEEFLKKCDRYQYEHYLENSVNRYACSSFGEAELQAKVADGFFAPKMAPWMDWWVNLWFGDAWDGCEIKRRKVIAFTIQPMLLALWIPFIALVRLFIAFFGSVILLREGVDFRPVIHPFAMDNQDVLRYDQRRWVDKPVRRLLLVPSSQFGMMFTALMLMSIFELLFGYSIHVFVVWYVIVLAVAVVLTTDLVDQIQKQKHKKAGKDAAEEMYKRYYPDELLCTTVPCDGTLRPKRQGFTNTVVLAYQELKARTCKPLAR